MWSSCIELFTQRISSVSTGQSQLVWNVGKNGIREKRKFWTWIESETVQRAENNTEEISSLVKIPRTPLASGNRMRQKLQSFQLLSAKSRLKHVYERAGFYHPVERNKWYQTRPDEDDGWGKITPMCREYTHPREHPDSRCFPTINANTKIGPILMIRMSQVFGIYGLEVQIPSPSRPRYSSWILICRGLEKFVDELHLHDRHITTPSSSLLRRRNDPEHVVMASELQVLGNWCVENTIQNVMNGTVDLQAHRQPVHT